MSARLALPHSQQRHSNIAVVHLRKGKKSIEIACYKNKVMAYRQGAETDLDEVIQIERIFTSVGRGEFASNLDVRHIVGEEMSMRDAIKYILDHGEFQVGSGERNMSSEELTRDVCRIIAEKVVHPNTKRPYPALYIEECLKAMGINLRLDQTPKRNAMFAVKEMCARQFVPVMRAQMRIKVVGASAADLAEYDPEVLVEEEGSVIVDIEPEHFRSVNEAGREWRIEVLDYAVSDTTMGGASAFSNFSAPKVTKREKREERRRKAKEARKAKAGPAVGASSSSEEDDDDDDEEE